MQNLLHLASHALPPIGQSHEFNLGPYRIVWQHLREGTSRGVERLTIISGGNRISLLPTRGMAIETADVAGFRFGWDAPLPGPVHPDRVPLADPSGLGWLDGFTELLCRCGVGNNGAPDFDANGKLQWPLHGRIGNLPASGVSLGINEAGELEVAGTIQEKRMHFWKWRLENRLTLNEAMTRIGVEDRLFNDSGAPQTCQMLYHYNVGPPVLQAGATVHVPVSRAVPREPHAGQDSEWNIARPPTPGRWESVWFARPAFDANGRTLAVLATPDRSLATAIRFDEASGLKCFTLWKNEVAEADGYVFGMEPGTNWPNRRSFEVEHGRCLQLEPGACQRMEVVLEFGVGSAKVGDWLDEVAAIQQSVSPQIVFSPDPAMCAG